MASTARFLFANLALTLVFCGCGPPPPRPDTLPHVLTDQDFWQLVTDLSEPEGYFPSDNFLSNESGYQEVIPVLLETLKPGGAYIGVGPEQNFTYIAAFQPKIAFIFDIRRQNMLEHLFYKPLIETSADRTEFLSRLFARPKVEYTANLSAEALFKAYRSSQPSPALASKPVNVRWTPSSRWTISDGLRSETERDPSRTSNGTTTRLIWT